MVNVIPDCMKSVDVTYYNVYIICEKPTLLDLKFLWKTIFELLKQNFFLPDLSIRFWTEEMDDDLSLPTLKYSEISFMSDISYLFSFFFVWL